MKNDDEWYRNKFGICCDCDNFMPEDFDCVESIINDVKPLQKCDKFKEVKDHARDNEV